MVTAAAADKRELGEAGPKAWHKQCSLNNNENGQAVIDVFVPTTCTDMQCGTV
jgi:hypothetical protein